MGLRLTFQKTRDAIDAEKLAETTVLSSRAQIADLVHNPRNTMIPFAPNPKSAMANPQFAGLAGGGLVEY